MYVYSHADSCIYVMYSWKQIKLHNTKLVKYLEKKEKKTDFDSYSNRNHCSFGIVVCPCVVVELFGAWFVVHIPLQP